MTGVQTCAFRSVVFNQLRTANPISPELTVFPVSGLSAVNSEIYQKAVDLTALINSVTTNGIAAITGDVPVLPLQEKPQLMSALPTPSPLLPKALLGIVATFALSSSLQEKSSLESPVPEMFGKR